MKTTHAFRNFLLGSTLFAAASTAAHAQITKTWNGGTDSNWGVSANWTSSGIPTSAMDVVFTSTSPNGYDIYFGTADRNAKSITFNSTTGATLYTLLLQQAVTDSTPRTLTVANGGIIVQAGSHTIKGVTSSSVAGNLSLTSGSAFDVASGSTLTFETKLASSSSSATFSKKGLGTLVLKATNGGTQSWNFSSGLFTVEAGTLELATNSASGNGGNDYSVKSGATLKISTSGGWGSSSGVLTLEGTGSSGVGALYASATTSFSASSLALAADSSIGVDVGQTLTINPIISGSAFGLTKVGAGTLTLAGANTYSGSTTISAGTVSASNIVVSGGNSNLGNASSAVTLGSAGSQGTLSYTGNSAMYIRGFTIGGTGGGRLDVTTSGQTLTVDTAGVDGTGLFTVGGAGDTIINTNLTHTGGLTKAGAGTLTLSGTNTYTGTTTISQGTLALGASASIASATIIVGASTTFDVSAVTGGFALGASQTLSGTGTVTGATKVSGTLSPGNSPGTMLVGSQTWLNGGDYNWQMLDATGVAGTGFDTISMTGTLDLNSLTAGGFSINLWSLASIGPDVSGDALNFNNALNQTWNILTASGGINGFEANDFVINTTAINDTAGFSNSLAGGGFSISQSGNNLVLNFTAIPEPGAALIGSLGLLALLRRRR